MNNWQPELFEGTYPTGRYTIQTNDRYGYDAYRQDWAEKTIAAIAKLTKGSAPLVTTFEDGEMVTRRGEFTYDSLPAEKPWWMRGVHRLTRRNGRSGDQMPRNGQGPVKHLGQSRGYSPALEITETIGGEPWPEAQARMLEVAITIGWGWTIHPGDYIPRDMAEVHAMQREAIAAA